MTYRSKSSKRRKNCAKMEMQEPRALSVQEVKQNEMMLKGRACFVNEVDFTREPRYRGKLFFRENGPMDPRAVDSSFKAQSRLAHVFWLSKFESCKQHK